MSRSDAVVVPGCARSTTSTRAPLSAHRRATVETVVDLPCPPLRIATPNTLLIATSCPFGVLLPALTGVMVRAAVERCQEIYPIGSAKHGAPGPFVRSHGGHNIRL